MPSYREDAQPDKIKEQVLQLDSLDNFKPISNSVLVRIDDRHDEITYGTLTLKLDTSFEVGKHAANKGVVIKVPEKFVYSKTPNINTSDWDTEIEVEEGDLVYFDYLAGIECNQIECKGELYYVLPYHTLYVAKRTYVWDCIGGINGEVLLGKDGHEYVWEPPGEWYRTIPLNGYVLLEPVIKEEGYKDFKFEREKAKYAIVAYSGSCNKRYRNKQYYDDPAIKAGEKVIYGKVSGLFLEQEEHSSFNGDKRYRIIQRRHLTGIIEKGEID